LVYRAEDVIGGDAAEESCDEAGETFVADDRVNLGVE
jgi:hypothetical protein